MMNKYAVTTFSDGALSGESLKSNSADALLEESYDLAIFVSSWEERCLCFPTSAAWTAKSTILILFTDRDSAGARDKHDEILKEHVKGHSQNVIIVSGRSIDIDLVWESLFDHILRIYGETKRPLRILLDSSTCPRYYVLAIVGACIAEGISGNISVTYAEGSYPCQTEGRHGAEEIKLTDGHWKAVSVPYFEGSYSPGKNRFYLISVGFEGWKTLRVVSRADPDRVSVLFPDPGFKPEYAARTRRDNEDLVKQFRIPGEQIISTAAGDAIDAWRALTDASLEREDSENAYFLCCGSKPHSLALGLRAMALSYPAVLYNLPQGHSAVPVVSNGVFWRYDLKSSTVPYQEES
ncbi:MAG: hypothetical protein K8H84_09985 [Sulfuricella denitrificans]|nr:hypothetical protein [Sulfuricella denitrificans]